MEVDVMLCDHAEAREGKLFINGAAINLFFVPAEPPHQISAYVAAVVHVPYTATNHPHRMTITLVDQDGTGVRPWVPDGAPEPPPVRIDAEFNVGRPANLPPGEAQTMPFAAGFQLPLPEIGNYVFEVEIDGSPMRSLPFRAIVRPDHRQQA